MFLYVPESHQWDVYVDFDIAGLTSNVYAGTAKHCLHCGARLKADGTVGDPNRPFGSYMPFPVGKAKLNGEEYELLAREVPKWD